MTAYYATPPHYSNLGCLPSREGIGPVSVFVEDRLIPNVGGSFHQTRSERWRCFSLHCIALGLSSLLSILIRYRPNEPMMRKPKGIRRTEADEHCLLTWLFSSILLARCSLISTTPSSHHLSCLYRQYTVYHTKATLRVFKTKLMPCQWTMCMRWPADFIRKYSSFSIWET